MKNKLDVLFIKVMTQKHFFYIILSFVFITSCSKSTDINDGILNPFEPSVYDHVDKEPPKGNEQEPPDKKDDTLYAGRKIASKVKQTKIPQHKGDDPKGKKEPKAKDNIPSKQQEDVPKKEPEPKVDEGNITPIKKEANVRIVSPTGFITRGQKYIFTVKCDDSSIDLTKGTWEFSGTWGKDIIQTIKKGDKVEYTLPGGKGNWSLNVKFTCPGTTGCGLSYGQYGSHN